ncbi:hypothetical protein TRFO_29167 [Tritrichomonas foetus]|nr:hypothetical protein TRFO_29167 [Tritrichomonas foetus]|eukprot:OHT03496.1 hypothetical protein TRFO_29167 [Tritrichomonas foetus]
MRLFFHKNCHLIQTKNYVDSKAPNFPEKQTFHECNNKFHLLSFSHTEIINVPAISEYIDVQNYIDSMNKTEIISLLQSNPNFDQFQCRIENELLKKEHNRLKQKISSLTYENTQLKQKITELNSSFCELSNKFSEIKAKSEKKIFYIKYVMKKLILFNLRSVA